MNHGRTKKEVKRDRESHYEGLAECTPDQKARDWFRRPAGVQMMIQAQAEQIRQIDDLYAEKCREVAELRKRDTAKEPAAVKRPERKDRMLHTFLGGHHD